MEYIFLTIILNIQNNSVESLWAAANENTYIMAIQMQNHSTVSQKSRKVQLYQIYWTYKI